MKSAKSWMQLLLFLVIMGGRVSPAHADTETVDGLTWRYTVSDGKVSLGGDTYPYGLYTAVPLDTSGAIVIPSTLGGDPVTSIGAHAFSGCRSLSSVIIPDSVTSIEDGAFSVCSSLTSVTIPDSVTIIGDRAFSGCSSLTSVTIPDSVTSIGKGAFYNCSLTNMPMPDSVRSIGEEAFAFCSGLTSVTIPDSVTHIGERAFYACYNLTSVTIPASVTSIGDGAFSDCSNLKEVSVSEDNPSYVVIDGVLFSKDGTILVCAPGSKSGRYAIPDGVTHIGNSAFSGCNLTSVTIPDSVTSIGVGAFESSSDLTSVTIPDSVTSIGHQAFRWSGLTSVTIPDSVICIGNSAFYNCISLTNVMIGNSVTSIGDNAFAYNRLENVTIPIPASVTNIGIGAWASRGLKEFRVEAANPSYMAIDGVLFSKDGKEVVCVPSGKTGFYAIPNGVTSIASQAFCWCRLTSVSIPDTVEDIGSGVFSESDLKTLYAPVAWKSKYVGWGFWSDYTGVPSGCNVVYGDAPAVALELEVTSRTFTAAAANGQTLEVMADVSWTANPSASWLMVKTAGGNGNGVITYDVAANTGMETRTGTITVSGGGLTRTFTVTQLHPGGIEWVYTVSDGNASVGSGSDTTAVPTNTYGAIVIPPTLGGYPVTSIGVSAFYACIGVTSVTIPDSVTSIREYAFASSGLTSVTIPDNVTDIGYAAFGGCNGLTSVEIPASVTNIGKLVFWFCHGLTNITVDPGNKCYLSKDGVLFTKSGDRLLCCPGGKSGTYAIPSGVASIGHGAFWDCSALASVSIPSSVASIEDEAFRECRALSTVTIPASVTNIGGRALYGCDSLQTLNVPTSWQGKMQEGQSWDSYAGVPATCEIIYYEPEMPTVTTTGVPYSWLESNVADILAAHGGDYEAAAMALATNKLPVWKCYVAGLSTTNDTAVFKVKSISIENGKPVVEWAPDLNENGTKTNRIYRVEGKPTLTNEWATADENSRFFRVWVGMLPK